MNWRVFAAMVCVVVCLPFGTAAGEDAAVAQGRKIARDACSPCHAIGATGVSAKAEAPPFRELGRKYPVESLEEALAEGVVVGHPEMPQVKMSEPEIAAFIAWLKTIQTP
ncbi:MAG: cytochrome c [Hyphomicrobiales bacterium]|nr:cytochrome c [Hyphomicrobiales bacterium]